MKFKLKSSYLPTGDQPEAINILEKSIKSGNKNQTLIGVTGSGKTFTVANLIERTQLPTLVISHNKTLAAQLYQELRDFFPENAVSYFVSYYDYYQPEAYIPKTDTYIEKEADINAEIDKLRLSSTANLITRPDCIVVASVSCIYSLGSPEEYKQYFLELTPGQILDRQTVISRLMDLQYQRTTTELTRGSYRVMGNVIQLFPSYEDVIIKMTFDERTLKNIEKLEPLNFTPVENKIDSFNHRDNLVIYPAKHYLTNTTGQSEIFQKIRSDLAQQVKDLKDQGKILEAHRIEQKVNYDLSQIQEFGFVNGVENYSRYFDKRNIGDPPYTLLDYLKYNADKYSNGKFLTVVDESHITIPQVRGMYRGDRARKETLVNSGFRLPAAYDNRPLNFTEFQARTPQTLYVSATPQDYEISLSKIENDAIAQQVIRPTGLLDPVIEVRPSTNQIKSLIQDIIERKEKGERVLILTMTKKTAEDLTTYLKDPEKTGQELKVQYLHSDVETLERTDILDDLRSGNFDCLIGINLLREGIDLPEVSLVAILDADKEGFLRTSTSLIQTMGRAARHINGKVILFADRISDSMQIAMDVTTKRRQIQEEYNRKNNITPLGINKPLREKLLNREDKKSKKIPKIKELIEFGWETPEQINPESLTIADKKKIVKKLKTMMTQAAKNWDFENAKRYRDILQKLN